MDDSGDHLYIARSNRVMVVDTASGKLVGEVTGVEGAHGVALVPKLNLDFATAGKLGQVLAFDLKSLKVVAEIKAGENSDAILYDSFTNRVFAFNGKSRNITVIDPKTKTVIGTIAVEGKPELGVSDGAGKIFLNFEDKSEVVAIDAKKMKVLHAYPLSPCEEPTGIAMNAATHHLFVGCGNGMAAVVDSRSGKVLQTLPVGKGVDGAAFDHSRKLAFFPAGEGNLNILRETKNGFEPFQKVTTQKGCKTVAVDSKSGKAYLPSAEYGPAPEASAEGKKRSRPPMLPGSFAVLVIGQ